MDRPPASAGGPTVRGGGVASAARRASRLVCARERGIGGRVRGAAQGRGDLVDREIEDIVRSFEIADTGEATTRLEPDVAQGGDRKPDRGRLIAFAHRERVTSGLQPRASLLGVTQVGEQPPLGRRSCSCVRRGMVLVARPRLLLQLAKQPLGSFRHHRVRDLIADGPESPVVEIVVDRVAQRRRHDPQVFERLCARERVPCILLVDQVEQRSLRGGRPGAGGREACEQCRELGVGPSVLGLELHPQPADLPDRRAVQVEVPEEGVLGVRDCPVDRLGELDPREVLEIEAEERAALVEQGCLLAAEPLLDDLSRAILALPPIARRDPATQLGHDLAEQRHEGRRRRLARLAAERHDDGVDAAVELSHRQSVDGEAGLCGHPPQDLGLDRHEEVRGPPGGRGGEVARLEAPRQAASVVGNRHRPLLRAGAGTVVARGSAFALP